MTGNAPSGQQFAIFTDFDGTLVEIADTPEAVRIPLELPRALSGLSRALDGALAVVSGREIADIDRMLFPIVLPVAGSHGAQRREPTGRRVDSAEESSDAAARVSARLSEFVAEHPMLVLERKAYGVSLHYRRAPHLEDLSRDAMTRAISTEPALGLMAGKMVFEARPVSASKGHAVEAFMAQRPFAGRRPIFIGDDTTDEDGFRSVQGLGGIGIKVGTGPTIAHQRLPDVAGVYSLLQAVAGGENPFRS